MGPWAGREGLYDAADANAVPAAGAFGALGIRGLKMKLHKAASARLAERNELVLDAEEVYDLAAAL